jgi:putative colanic acid biosynthesis acetyltransferase WcaF
MTPEATHEDVTAEPRWQDLSRFTLPQDFRGRPAWYVQLWWLVQTLLVHPSPQVFYGWRRFWLRLFGARIGAHVRIRPSVEITYPWKLTVGDWTWIGDGVTLYTLGEISIGAHAVVSQKSYLCSGAHDYRRIGFDIYARAIRIEPEAWLAANVFVAPGVTVGRGSVIGACSNVMHDIPAGMVCYGNPAAPIRPRETRP